MQTGRGKDCVISNTGQMDLSHQLKGDGRWGKNYLMRCCLQEASCKTHTRRMKIKARKKKRYAIQIAIKSIGITKLISDNRNFQSNILIRTLFIDQRVNS